MHAYFVFFVDADRTVWRKSDVPLRWRRELRCPAETGAARVRAASAAECFDLSRFPVEIFSAPTVVVFNTGATLVHSTNCYRPNQRWCSWFASSASAPESAVRVVAGRLNSVRPGTWNPGSVIYLLVLGRSSSLGPSVLRQAPSRCVACPFPHGFPLRRAPASLHAFLGWHRTRRCRPDAYGDPEN